MLQNLSLRRKFSLLLGLTCLVVFASAYGWLSSVLSHQVEREVTERAAMILQSMQAIRDYTSEEIAPLLQARSSEDESEEFMPQMVPSFSANTVFQKFRSEISMEGMLKYDFSDFQYKEAAGNPTQIRDQADAFEQSLIQGFKDQPSLELQQGYRTDRGRQEFFIARPIAIQSQSCLQCHGQVAQAPASLRKLYGDDGGFGWEMNEVVAAQTLYLPVAEVRQRQGKLLHTVMLAVVAIFLVAFWGVNTWLRKLVVTPVNQLTAIADKIQNFDTCCPETLSSLPWQLHSLNPRRDELGQLARSFHVMVQMLLNRNQDLQAAVDQQTQDLQKEIRDRQKTQKALQIYFHAVSHDLRNLVMGSSLVVQGIHRKAIAQSPIDPLHDETPTSPPLVDVPMDLIQTLETSCDRQLGLVNSLMKTHDSEIWSSLLRLEKIQLDQWLQCFMAEWETRPTEFPITFIYEIPADLPEIEVDPTQLWRVFENLIENAIKYNAQPLQITLTAELEESEGRPKQIRCHIRDNGIGLIDLDSERLFEPYHRQADSQSVQGYGLGLYICRQILIAHGGDIGTTPDEQGAHFWLTLLVQ